jgi:hypothetical protein
MQRINRKQLESKASIINTLTKSPQASYAKIDDKYLPNVGNYHIDGAYGGFALYRIMCENGSVENVFNTGHTSARELFNLMQAFIIGIQTAQNQG